MVDFDRYWFITVVQKFWPKYHHSGDAIVNKWCGRPELFISQLISVFFYSRVFKHASINIPSVLKHFSLFSQCKCSVKPSHRCSLRSPGCPTCSLTEGLFKPPWWTSTGCHTPWRLWNSCWWLPTRYWAFQEAPCRPQHRPGERAHRRHEQEGYECNPALWCIVHLAYCIIILTHFCKM